MRKILLVIGLLYLNNDIQSQDFRPDTSVNRINIESSYSIKERFKSDTILIEKRFKESENVFRNVSFLNEDKTQILSLIFHPGDSKFSFSEFKIWYKKDFIGKEVLIQLEDIEFVTENGIKLGMSKTELLGRIGKPKILKNVDGFEIIEYRVSDPNSRILKKYFAPEYFAIYKLKNMRIVEFHFGFVYP